MHSKLDSIGRIIIMYFIDNTTKLIKFVDGNFTAIFNEYCTEGRYYQYLAWIAEGNTPEEWQPES